jgi:hypothetical protein
MNSVKTLSLTFLAALPLSFTARAENRAASNCEIYISEVGQFWHSGGSTGLTVRVRTNHLNPNETIRKVGWHGKKIIQPKGGMPEESSWTTVDGYRSENGDYLFSFFSRHGSQNFHTSIGVFFVETDQNTYWLNPDLNPNQNYYFDSKAQRLLYERDRETNKPLPTTREDMRYYNPLGCH